MSNSTDKKLVTDVKPKLSNIFDKSDSIKQEVCIVLVGSVDAGKCFGYDTKIMGYDGRLINVQDIKVGDKLMGDDSTMRTVLETHRGMSQLYKITPSISGNNEQPYIVNGEHILCLKYCPTEKFNRCIYNETKNEVYIKYFVWEDNAPIEYRHIFESDDKDVSMQEAEHYLNSIQKLNANDIVEISVYEFLKLKDQVQKMFRWFRNEVEFNEKVETQNMIFLENTPDTYKYSNKSDREQYLTKLMIKTDTRSKDGIYIMNLDTSVSEQFNNYIKDLVYIIRSLGYTLYNKYNEELEDIELKTDSNYQLIFGKQNTYSVIDIQRYGFGAYYGFELDGNGRFLLGDCSVAHNSSFIGVMKTGKLDDGNGSARSFVAKHKHEHESGKTSDISIQHIELNKDKDLTMVDLCGHEKYLKTTLFGITGYFPDYGIVIVAANRGVLPMTKEHIRILVCLRIPFIIIITRADLIENNHDQYEKTKQSIENLLKPKKQSQSRAIFINTDTDLKLSPDKLNVKEEAAIKEVIDISNKIKSNHNIIPVITVSNKTGYYINTIRSMLGALNPRNIWRGVPIQTGSIFYIDNKFTPPGVGLVVSGVLKGESIKVGDNMLIGPYGKEFISVRVWSLHDNEEHSITELTDKRRGCLALRVLDKKTSFTKESIRKGCVVISNNGPINNICYQLTANIQVLNHSTTISKKYSPVIHCGTVRQTAKIVLAENQVLKMGDKASVIFRFVDHPEFVEEGTTFFFREGTTRGVGKVTGILSIKDDPDPNPTLQRRRIIRRRIRHKNPKVDKNDKKPAIKSTKSKITVL